jgi:Flp pilus assembly protein TadD
MHEQILDALRRGAAAEALSAARDAVTTQPQDATSQRLLAAALHLTGDRPAALAAIDTALTLTPDDAGLHVERAGLLLDARQLDDAETALAQAIGLDPNQFPAYIIQGQLALGRGDLAEAERISRTAARIAPSHPQVAAIEGMVALRRGDADRALAILAQAADRAPEEPTLRNALGFAYMAKGHFAFAEQCFRRLLEKQPDSVPLRALIADLVRRQGRPADAADEAASLLERENVSPGLQRVVGELELEAGRTERALAPLKAAFAAMPRDRRTRDALIEAWRRNKDFDDARRTLDAALAAEPQEDDLWRARLVFELYAGPEALAIVERWQEARPDHIPALQARAAIHDQVGETEEADAIAYQIVAIEPGHAQAELRIVDRLLQRDPAVAVARVQDLLAKAEDDGAKRGLRQLLARCFNIAGDTAAAASLWAALQAEVADQRLPLPPLTTALGELPPLAPLPDPAPGVLLIWGAPGSLAERIAMTFDAARAPLRADRFGPQPPSDPLQRYGTPQELLDGRLDGSFLVSQWRAALPARGINDGQVFDWLLWWDNALLHALRPHLPEAVVMIAIRDPRDMLLDWLAYGSPQRFALESPETAARWLAALLAQVAELHERDLFPHRLLKLDDIAEDPAALAATVGEALEIQLPPLPSFGPSHFPRDRWRAYTGPLADAFATLTPVAMRLGYPER